MAKDLFYSLDLNLLKTFLVLSQELNMRKASQRLYVSQPAISQSLQKLWHHFSDQLFVKVPSGLKATPYAEQLAENITPLLDGLANALNASSVFSPKNINKTVKIALSPQVLCTVSGVLIQKLKQQAPNLDIHLLNWSASTLEDISKGKIDFGLNYDYPVVPKELQIKKLIEVEGIVLVRKNHPITLSSATPYDFAGFEIASLIIPGWNDNKSIAAEIMESHGLAHRVGFRSEFPMALIDVVQHTDMYFPTYALFPIQEYPLLRSINLTIEGTKEMVTLVSYYHKKDGQSALINWLNEMMSQILHEQESFTQT